MNARRKNKQTRNESRNKSPEKREKWKIEFVLLFRIGWKSLTHFRLWTYKRRRRDSPHNNYKQQKHTANYRAREKERKTAERWWTSERLENEIHTHDFIAIYIWGQKQKEMKKDRVKLNAMLWHISWKNLCAAKAVSSARPFVCSFALNEIINRFEYHIKLFSITIIISHCGRRRCFKTKKSRSEDRIWDLFRFHKYGMSFWVRLLFLF